jgi:hypothetical protein
MCANVPIYWEMSEGASGCVGKREERSFTTEDTESTEGPQRRDGKEVKSSKLKVEREKADPSTANDAVSG